MCGISGNGKIYGKNTFSTKARGAGTTRRNDTRTRDGRITRCDGLNAVEEGQTVKKLTSYKTLYICTCIIEQTSRSKNVMKSA